MSCKFCGATYSHQAPQECGYVHLAREITRLRALLKKAGEALEYTLREICPGWMAKTRAALREIEEEAK